MALDVRPYSVLAAGYDAVMDHVDYPNWARYVRSLFELHGGIPKSVIEFGCGTAAFSKEFSKYVRERYVGTDASEEMLKEARKKFGPNDRPVEFRRVDFRNAELEEQFEAGLLVYDGLNYLTEATEVEQFFDRASRLLVPSGIFIFDQATPANSSNNAPFFEDSGVCDAFSYVRRNSYDPELYMHETVFELTTENGRFLERHLQRAYQLSEIRNILENTDFTVEGTYGDFTFDTADDFSERIHWVVRKRSD